MKKMKEDNVDGEDMKEKPKNIIINLTTSLGVIPVSYTHLTLPTT